MRRLEVTPRPGWQQLVAEQGLVYEATHDDAGNLVGHYWNESAVYEFDAAEVESLEQVAEQLHRMALEAGAFLLEENLARPGRTPFSLGLPTEAVEYAQASWQRGDPSLYGRFDLVWQDADHGPAKLLEYNADTPTGLVEAAICQWYRHTDADPAGSDQWNGLHEALVARFGAIRAQLGMSTLHLAHTRFDTSGEDLMTVGYLRECASAAGWDTIGLEMGDIGFDALTSRFCGADDEFLAAIFKLYPWEDMVTERFGHAICATQPNGWLEPAWKMALGSKMLTAALWHLFPGHDNLLACYPDGPRHLVQWVSKPLWSREGANVEVNSIEFQTATSGAWEGESRVWQDYCALPDFRGSDGSHNRAVLGVWIVGDECFGAGIRESDGPVTDRTCRFVPNRIAG